MQLAGALATGRTGSVYPVAWPEERRLYAEGFGCCPDRTEVVLVDPVERSVVARVPLDGVPVSFSTTADGIVFVLESNHGIKPVRVVEIDREGGARSVIVSQIKAGTKWRGNGSNRRASMRQPGFAVDRAGAVAYVIDPAGLVARIELTTLDVSYHSGATRRIARAKKRIEGPMLFARWMGDGRIAISGATGRSRKTATGWQQTWSPAGLAVLDTRTWMSRILDVTANYFTTAGDSVLVAGNGALTAYDRDGDRRYTVSIPVGNAYVSVFGDYAYAWSSETVTLLDVRSGSVVASLPKPSFYLVAADS